MTGGRAEVVPAAGSADVVVASNRGPVSFVADGDGSVGVRRGAGGLVSALQAIGTATSYRWVCAALTETDRIAARSAPSGRFDGHGRPTAGGHVRMLALDADTFHRAYNGVANQTLWFCHHLLADASDPPVYDTRWRRDWQAYVDYGTRFADILAEEASDRGRVLVQDYHLTLTPRLLRARRPDLGIGYFAHTPWAPAEHFAQLPDDVAEALLAGVLGADHAGFLTRRWATAFAECCARFLGAAVEANGTGFAIRHKGGVTTVGVHPLGVDGDRLTERASHADVAARAKVLRTVVGDRRLIVRVDRTDPSKNILRGLLAYRELLRSHPEWHDRVVHLACAYPSRQGIPSYREYTASVQRLADEISDEFSRPGWRPLVLAVEDDFARSLAAYQLADVAVVNPVRDGMNLVAKEIPVVSTKGCALVLSRDAGAAEELAADAFLVNPYDVTSTAEAMHAALLLPEPERRARTDRLAAAATACSPKRWLDRQLAALGGDPESAGGKGPAVPAAATNR